MGGTGRGRPARDGSATRRKRLATGQETAGDDEEQRGVAKGRGRRGRGDNTGAGVGGLRGTSGKIWQ